MIIIFKHFYSSLYFIKEKTPFFGRKVVSKWICEIDSNLIENTKWILIEVLRLLKNIINLKSIQSPCHWLYMTYFYFWKNEWFKGNCNKCINIVTQFNFLFFNVVTKIPEAPWYCYLIFCNSLDQRLINVDNKYSQKCLFLT